MTMARGNLFMVVSSLVVGAVVIAVFFILGSPGQARLHRLDERRVQDLTTLSNAIEGYRRGHDALPERLEQLIRPGTEASIHMADPKTNKDYEYRVQDARSYDLCAIFETTRAVTGQECNGNPFWNHGVGRTCFRIEVNTHR